MLGEWEGWLQSQYFAAQAIKEEKNKSLAVVCKVLFTFRPCWLPMPGWGGMEGVGKHWHIRDLHSHRRDRDANNLSLALFWGAWLSCILKDCPAVLGMILKRVKSHGKVFPWFMSWMNPDRAKKKKRRKEENILMQHGSSVPGDGSGRLMMPPGKNPKMGTWFWEWIHVLLCCHFLPKC